MANTNSLFNYGTPPEEGGWKVFSNDKFEDAVVSSDIAGANPNQAVPSPYARFEVARRAFENLASGKEDMRDNKTVSDVLDVLQVLFEGSSQFAIERANISVISDKLIDLGSDKEDEKHLKIYGEAIRDYFARESFMHIPNQRNSDTLYIFTKGSQPFAITSPTSIVLPTPDTWDYRWEQVLVEGTYPVFRTTRRLTERNRNFVIYLYRLMKAIKDENGDYPKAIKPMADYLDKEYGIMDRVDPSLFDEIKDIRNHAGEQDFIERYEALTDNGNLIGIYGVTLGRIKKSMASDEVANESDLILKPSKNIDAEAPLVLSSNIPEGARLKYTSGTNFWDSSDSKLPYNDEVLKNTPIEARATLPNGTPYPPGYIFDHDFLSDYIIRLPYKFNKDIFFNGNPDDEDLDIGFIPPITETYFNYFTVEDLQEQMSIKFKKADGKVTGVEVLLSIPVKSGERVILKKVYTEIDQEIGWYRQIASKGARGMIVPIDMAIAYFPNIKFSEKEYNHYLFQLARNEYSLPEFNIELEAIGQSETEENLHLKRAIRNCENSVNTIVHYALDDNGFSYLRLSLERNSRNDQQENPVSAILIPINFKYYDVNRHRQGLTFGFDFGTSNTHVAVMTNAGEDSRELKFELPIHQCVSTISNEALLDTITGSFKEYQSQLILPEDRRFGFPLPTVISRPKRDYNGEINENAEIPFLFASIPFQYGKEDYGVSYNNLERNLKWNISNTENGKNRYSKAFINEMVFLAQVFAVEHDASLSNSEITWSYPISMSPALQRELKRCWENAFRKYFYPNDNHDGKVKSFTESMAPMVFYQATQGNDAAGTVVSIDIGGGTSDIVITPDSKFEDSKLASVGLGGDTLFAIEDVMVEETPMVRLALEQISSKIKTHKRNQDDRRFDNVLRELENLQSGLESEATNVLFSLPLKRELRDLREEVDFNKWLISRPAFHPVIHYYYASILYYLADLMRKNPTTYIWAPEKFFFSGSGSKILNVIGKGNDSTLSDFTVQLFWFFLDDHEFEKDSGDFLLRMERQEPKEITAKGCIIQQNEAEETRSKIIERTQGRTSATAGRHNNQDNSETGGSRRGAQRIVRGSSQNGLSEVVVKHKLIPSLDQGGAILTEGMLSDEGIQNEILEEVKKFHEAFKEFIEGAIETGDFYDKDDLDTFERDFFKKNIGTALSRQMRAERLDRKQDSDTPYADVPFFLVIKRLIQQSVRQLDNTRPPRR